MKPGRCAALNVPLFIWGVDLNEMVHTNNSEYSKDLEFDIIDFMKKMLAKIITLPIRKCHFDNVIF